MAPEVVRKAELRGEYRWEYPQSQVTQVRMASRTYEVARLLNGTWGIPL